MALRQIGPADIEFYYGGLVMKVARTLSDATPHPLGQIEWDNLSHRSRQTYLNKAVAIVGALVNDETSMQALKTLAERV